MDNGTNSSPNGDQRLSEVIAAYLEAVDAGWAPARDQVVARYPELSTELLAFFASHDEIARLADPSHPAPLPFALPAEETGRKLDTSSLEPPTALLSPAAARLLALPRRLGDYELLEEIKRGGMGVVYRARQVSLNRIVALKVMLTRPGTGSADLQRFRREAEAAANLDHPHIVPIYEVGEQDGVGYFSMKLIDGGSLADHLDDFTHDQKAAAQLLATVARAVHHAHQRGVLHRDLKPGNILLASGGRKPPDNTQRSGGLRPPLAEAIPFVSDFGLVKRIHAPDAPAGPNEPTPLPRAFRNGRTWPPSGEESTSLTEAGVVVGTPNYMAPEQACRGDTLTTATDVFGLGALLYKLLTGKPPFDGGGLESTLRQVTECTPRPPRMLNRRIDPRLEAVCMKCLAKDPAARYPSAEALADDLARWLRGEPPLAWPLPLRLRVWRAVRWHVLVGTTTAVGAAAVVLALLIAYYSDPNRTLVEIQTRLGEGKAVTLIGPTSGPTWSRWSRGEDACQVFANKDEPFAFRTFALGMLKLVADPQKERYRFSAEVRHDDVADTGDIGLYFGFTSYPIATGIVHYWCELSFADRGTNARMPVLPGGPPRSRVTLVLRRQLEPGGNHRPTMTPVFEHY
ncbi:MAG TPA: serine/threonine-protein kinase, partial [Gemmataceae bacterium]|nr:serine/threonine-protein kinase [Gemmataceae bacterium]